MTVGATDVDGVGWMHIAHIGMALDARETLCSRVGFGLPVHIHIAKIVRNRIGLIASDTQSASGPPRILPGRRRHTWRMEFGACPNTDLLGRLCP